VSRFRQITTSLKRLLGFIRTLLDRTGARDLLHALLRSVGGTGSALTGLTSEELRWYSRARVKRKGWTVPNKLDLRGLSRVVGKATRGYRRPVTRLAYPSFTSVRAQQAAVREFDWAA